MKIRLDVRNIKIENFLSCLKPSVVMGGKIGVAAIDDMVIGERVVTSFANVTPAGLLEIIEDLNRPDATLCIDSVIEKI